MTNLRRFLVAANVGLSLVWILACGGAVHRDPAGGMAPVFQQAPADVSGTAAGGEPQSFDFAVQAASAGSQVEASTDSQVEASAGQDRQEHRGNPEVEAVVESDGEAPTFQNASEIAELNFADAVTIQQINEAIPDEYLLGPGDLIDIQIWDHTELSGQQTIGPDGQLALPFVGELAVEGLTRTQASELVRQALSRYYKELFVNFQVLQYNNNRVFVLGRVSNPGMVSFTGRPNLLEALSLAGSIPVLDQTTQLTKCAVIRGSNQIIWIDLKELLVHGNISLNLRLVNNDVIFIPDGRDALVYVMGEVRDPGAYRITTELSFLDALMLAGGTTEDARRGHITLVRSVNGKSNLLTLNLDDFRRGDFSKNILLAENDIVFVPRRGIANFNYFLRQLSPFAQWFLVREAIVTNRGD